MSAPPADRTTVYWLRGDRTEILYIGIAADIGRRISQHAKTKPWWSDVCTITVMDCDSRAEALELERYEIERLHPHYNVTHNEVAIASGSFHDGDEDLARSWQEGCAYGERHVWNETWQATGGMLSAMACLSMIIDGPAVDRYRATLLPVPMDDPWGVA